MPTPPLSPELCIEALNALQRNNGNVTRAARELGLNRSTFEGRVRTAETRGFEPNETPPKDQPPVAQTKASVKPRVRVRAVTHETPPSGPITRVLALGDMHDAPSIPDKSRFKWIGKHIADWSPDAVVDIGDSCTFDSLCSYEGNDTHGGKLKPSVQEDLDSYAKANEALWGAASSWRGQKYKTRGNHEDRMYSFENRNPEVWGMIQGEYRRIIERHEIDERPYGEFLFIGGVGFIHVPMSGLGKPMNCEGTLNPLGNRAVFDIVFGHTHRFISIPFPKIGPQKEVRIVNVGCGLPWGHVEDYAKKSLVSWWWGVVELTIQAGRTTSVNPIPMTELERRYG